MNPLTHYLRYGITKGWVGFPRPRYADLPGEDAENTLREREAYQAPLEFLSGDGEKKQLLPKEHDTAVILHVYYPEVFQEIASYLANLDGDFDLYVSVPESHAEYAHDILASLPQARLYLTENRGRDIAPFLRLLPTIQSLGYRYLLKLHTKQSPHRVDGKLWRQEVYEKLVGSREMVSLAKNRLHADPQAGILGPKGHVLNNRLYAGGNAANISLLAYKAGIAAWQEVPFFFVAGTMFWAKPEAFQSFQNMALRSTDFEPEPIEADGALVHGVERFFGLAAVHAGFKTLEIDVDGQITEPDPDHIYKYAPVPQYHLLGKSKKIKSVVFFRTYQEEFAIEYLRVTAPLRQIGIEIIDGGRAGEANPDKVFYGDAVLFQREFPQFTDILYRILDLARGANKPVIFDLDDMLFNLPDGHPEKALGAYTSSLLPMLSAVVEADLVTVSTPQLQKHLLSFNPNVVVLPNYLDDNLWAFKPPRSCHAMGNPIRIGYMGSSSHIPDLEFIMPVLIELLNRYPGKLQIHIWGTEPPHALMMRPEVRWIPSPSNKYVDFARYFQTQCADIFVAPLLDNVFNHCKSPIKFLEYSALGVAGVYSRITPYEQIIQHGENGFLASTQNEWLEYLIRLVEDEQLRMLLAANAQTTLRSNWLLTQNIGQLYKIFDHLPELVATTKRVDGSMAMLIRSITQQLLQSYKKQNDEIIHLRTQRTSVSDEPTARKHISIRRHFRSYSLVTWLKNKVTAFLAWIKRPIRYYIRSTMVWWNTKFRQRMDFVRFKKLVQKCPLFDQDWYLENYPDVAAAKIDPVRHYLLYGGFEGRDPGPDFSSSHYLNTYPDVLDSGINPLIHYLRFGSREARLIKGSRVRQVPDSEVEPSEIGTEKVLQPADLMLLITEKMMYKRYVLSISHNSYLKSTGGVQLYIAQEQKSHSQQGTSYLHLFPHTFLEHLLQEETELLVGINLDGVYIGVSNITTLIDTLKTLDGITLANIYIHHLMGFSMDAIQHLLELGSHRAVLWLHDFFTLCPSFHLLRNDHEYCAAPDQNSNACSICKYIDLRKQQKTFMQQLFNRNDIQVVAPSNFVMDLWKEKFPSNNYIGKIAPLASIRWTDHVPIKHNKHRWRIGFLGYPMEHKGWSAWMKLVVACAADDRYQFFHFSWAEGTPGNYHRIHVAVNPEKPSMMIDALRQENIDVALLWSVVPETFSFTLHEALAAGCFIVTNKKSGNIQDFLRRNPEYGMVLDSESDLLALFANGELARRVKQYQAHGKPTGELVHHGS
ncbi:MAG: glycosyltransferase [Anaerolineales bacterium]|nr:glycosyltransferase [Anaerolineales bacterium]